MVVNAYFCIGFSHGNFIKRKKNMNYQEFNSTINSRERELEMSQAFPVLMRKVYTWMALALVITGVTAYGVAHSPAVLQAIYGNPIAFWVLAAAELGIVFYTSARIQKIALTTATLMFILFSVINGVTLAYIFLVYTASSIAKVFFITAGTFAAMAVFGYTTKRDLSKMGSIMMMALIGLIIAGIVNIFLKSSGLDFIICIAGVLIFVGLTAWDTQKIKEMLMDAEDAGESSQKIALLGALSLYLDFINLFIHLLRLLGNRE